MAGGGSVIEARKLLLWAPTVKTFPGEDGPVAVLHQRSAGYGVPVPGVSLDDGGLVSSAPEYLTVAPCGTYDPIVNGIEDEGFNQSKWVWVRVLESEHYPDGGGTNRVVEVQTFSTREAALASVGISTQDGAPTYSTQWSQYCASNTVTTSDRILSQPINYIVFRGYPVSGAGSLASALGTPDVYGYEHQPITDVTREDVEDYVLQCENVLYPPAAISDTYGALPSLAEDVPVYLAESIPVDYPEANCEWIRTRFDPNWITGNIWAASDVSALRRKVLFDPVPDSIPREHHAYLKGTLGPFVEGGPRLFAYYLVYAMYATAASNNARTLCRTKVLRAAWPDATKHWKAQDPMGRLHEGDVASHYSASEWMFQVRRRYPYTMIGSLGLNYSRHDEFEGFSHLIEDARTSSNDIGSLEDMAYPNGPYHPEDAFPLFEDVKELKAPSVPDRRYDASYLDWDPIYN